MEHQVENVQRAREAARGEHAELLHQVGFSPQREHREEEGGGEEKGSPCTQVPVRRHRVGVAVGVPGVEDSGRPGYRPNLSVAATPLDCAACRQRGRSRCRAQPEGDVSHLPAFLCDPPPRGWIRHPDDPGAAGPQECADDHDLHARLEPGWARRPQPTRLPLKPPRFCSARRQDDRRHGPWIQDMTCPRSPPCAARLEGEANPRCIPLPLAVMGRRWHCGLRRFPVGCLPAAQPKVLGRVTESRQVGR